MRTNRTSRGLDRRSDQTRRLKTSHRAPGTCDVVFLTIYGSNNDSVE